MPLPLGSCWVWPLSLKAKFDGIVFVERKKHDPRMTFPCLLGELFVYAPEFKWLEPVKIILTKFLE